MLLGVLNVNELTYYNLLILEEKKTTFYIILLFVADMLIYGSESSDIINFVALLDIPLPLPGDSSIATSRDEVAASLPAPPAAQNEPHSEPHSEPPSQPVKALENDSQEVVKEANFSDDDQEADDFNMDEDTDDEYTPINYSMEKLEQPKELAKQTPEKKDSASRSRGSNIVKHSPVAKCELCSKEFHTNKGYAVHMKRVHKISAVKAQGNSFNTFFF